MTRAWDKEISDLKKLMQHWILKQRFFSKHAWIRLSQALWNTCKSKWNSYSINSNTTRKMLLGVINHIQIRTLTHMKDAFSKLESFVWDYEPSWCYKVHNYTQVYIRFHIWEIFKLPITFIPLLDNILN